MSEASNRSNAGRAPRHTELLAERRRDLWVLLADQRPLRLDVLSMSPCATVLLGVEQFRLAETLCARPRVRVEFERFVPLEDRSIPYLWVTGVDTDTCLQGFGTADGWQLSLRFPSRKRLADCYQQCARGGVSLTVDRVHTTSWSVESGHEAVLTDIQRETLTAALEAGYFAVPRTATLQDLADEFGVSDTAISQRIRRGVARLLTTELSEG
jgi:hypothetical protein